MNTTSDQYGLQIAGTVTSISLPTGASRYPIKHVTLVVDFGVPVRSNGDAIHTLTVEVIDNRLVTLAHDLHVGDQVSVSASAIQRSNNGLFVHPTQLVKLA